MTVRDLRARMDQSEYTFWSRYFSRRAQEQELELLKIKGG